VYEWAVLLMIISEMTMNTFRFIEILLLPSLPRAAPWTWIDLGFRVLLSCPQHRGDQQWIDDHYYLYH
jgi:hypothetical protein